jgi:hypothetical protein
LTGKDLYVAIKQDKHLADLIGMAGQGGSFTGEDSLIISAILRNISSTRKVDYTSWGGNDAGIAAIFPSCPMNSATRTA